MRKINLLLPVLGIMALAQNASAAPSVDEQVKMLAERYRQVEDQLTRSVHYVSKSESAGAATVAQAWFNGADDAIKVAIERTDPSGRELTEYFPLDLNIDFGSERLFMLSRKETPLPDGGTQVEESRKYFWQNEDGSGQLIRELRKSARFKPGESTDTVHTPNRIIDLRRQPKDNRSDGERRKPEAEFFNHPQRIAMNLKEAGQPEVPFANIKGDSDKFRVIHGSASPDGRFAIAMGLPPEQSGWDALEDGDTYFYESGIYDFNVPNYVVDLTQRKILGETGCNYFGTRRTYNHRECIVTWSPDSLKFVQLWADKWSSTACVAGKINPGPKLAGVVDLLEAIGEKTYAFVRQQPETGLSLDIKKVANDGAIDLDASESIQFGDRKGDTEFAVNERLRLHETPSGLRVDVLKMRRLRSESSEE